MSKQTDLLNLTDGISVDASGNVGIGVTPETDWWGSVVALQINRGASISDNGAPGGRLAITQNARQTASNYITGWNYQTTDEAAQYLQIAGQHVWNTAPSGTADAAVTWSERMRIDSSGNVGIGTSAPASYNAAGQNLVISDAAGASGLTIASSASGSGHILFADSTVGTGAYDGLIRYDHTTQSMRFGVNAGSERMRIDSSGNVLVGTTTAGGNKTHIAFNNSVENGMRFSHTSATYTKPSIVFVNQVGSQVGSIKSTGTATSYITTSDYRLKENVTLIQGAGDIVKAMRPVTYTYKSDGSWMDGFLAHELQELHPRAVTGSKDAMQDEEYEVTPAVEATYDDEGVELTPAVPAVMGTRSVPDYQGVDYSKLTPILTAALQEALNKIDALEARLTALEATP